MNAMFTLAAIVILTILLLLFTRRQQHNRDNGRLAKLRPLTVSNTLANQMGVAIESGRRLHLSLGRASLIGSANPTSIAAVHVLDHLAKDGCASGTPPLTTVGEGTLLPLAQDSLRQGYSLAGRRSDFQPGMAQFVATDSDPFAFAGGLSTFLGQNKASSNVLVGRYGPELALVTDAAARNNMDQVIGTDDPTALAVATAVTNNVLIGEELFAVGAYLEGNSSQIASLYVQDILRLLITLTILGLVVFQLIAG